MRACKVRVWWVVMGIATVCCLLPFRYYDNGRYVTVPVAVLYAREASAYGRKVDTSRRLPPDWGRWIGYAARNFTLDLWGLDYSQPLRWNDIAAGEGIVLRVLEPGPNGPRDSERVIAVYPNGEILPGRKFTVVVKEVRPATPDRRYSDQPRYRLVLYRPPFAHVTYVLSVEEYTGPKAQ